MRSKKSPKANVNPVQGINQHSDLAQIKESIARQELVLVVGTGVSIALTEGKMPSMSWAGLVQDGFAHAQKKGLISDVQFAAWQAQLNSTDIDDLLGAAEFVSRKLSAPNGDLYSRWLEHVFKAEFACNEALARSIVGLKNARIPFCTLNYDHLLESVTSSQAITLDEVKQAASWMRNETDGILHLHGSWTRPATCVLGIRDYDATLRSEIRDLMQKSMCSFKRLLFVGCGETFSDPNFTALVKWLREKMNTAAPQHYALVLNSQVSMRHADPSWRGFVEPIGYGERFQDLPQFLDSLLPSKNLQNKSIAPSGPSVNDDANSRALLQRYREYLVRDCGQMTIEGVRADMELGQRKFDLERLFVPLKVTRCSPEFSKNDPQAQQKLDKWVKRFGKPVDFGKAFTSKRCLALLALPGGGKTLLLKRLAVAYANPNRRNATEDHLPSVDLTPVLIRCREWREYIGKPILTLLGNLAAITGQLDLDGLREALVPLLQAGNVLLLVDGLDEIHDDAGRESFVEHLEAFLDQYPRIKLVVTSREAGFGLIAPRLSRFCERWRVAPLEPDAIRSLCDHWRCLMAGDSSEAVEEMGEVVRQLLSNPSLNRLAENPLLLTMLLVVKHGAGRLPPDRVSLYGRAVEVLLDTWNIKGHEPLNLKESVPQLACIAFQLMKQGKQTATEKELLKLLEEARDRLPHIRRYSKGSPLEFLKRVELRSSVLLEAGRQVDAGITVPFYQFRHLTFQEYLAAVAAAEGHYLDYETNDNVLTPLAHCLLSDEWKEVVPMAAVLSRKQAEPLILELIRRVSYPESTTQARADKGVSKSSWQHLDPAIPRIMQCLVEEAEASPETITSAIQVVASCAKIGQDSLDLRTIGRGPYGTELFHHSWLLFRRFDHPFRYQHSVCATIAGAILTGKAVTKGKIDPQLNCLLTSDEDELVARGLFAIADRFDTQSEGHFDLNEWIILREPVVANLKHRSSAVVGAAIWAWTLMAYYSESSTQLSDIGRDSILEIWLESEIEGIQELASVALWTQMGLPRSRWAPNLTGDQIEKVRQLGDKANVKREGESNILASCIVIAFHSKTVWQDRILNRMLSDYRKRSHAPHGKGDVVESMKSQLHTPD